MLLARPAAAEPEDVRLLPSGPQVVHFIVEVPPPRLETVAGVPGTPEAVDLTLQGYGDGGNPGERALPQRVVHVAVPPSGEVRVRAVGSGAEVQEGIDLAPLPRRGEDPEPWRYARSPEAYASRSSRSPERAQLGGVSWLRNQRVAEVVLWPADYQPAYARLSVYRQIEVEVQVSPAGEVGPPLEPEDPFEGVYRGALVNYEQGQAWRRSTENRPGLSEVAPRPFASPAGLDGGHVFAGRKWARIAIPRTGFYKVEFGDLPLFAGSDSVSLDSLRLFTWPGFPVVPERSFCDSCDYQEVAIGIIDDGDPCNCFNGQDAFYFFGLGASDWANLYDPSLPDTVFLNHPYETTNYYYVTVSTADHPVPGIPRRMGSISGAVQPGVGGITPTTFTARAHFEEDDPAEYWPNLSPVGYGGFGVSTLFWEKWFWTTLDVGRSCSMPVGAPGIDPGSPARLRVRLWGLDAALCGGIPEHVVDLSTNGTFVARYPWGLRAGGFEDFTIDTTVSGLGESNTLRLDDPVFASCSNRTLHGPSSPMTAVSSPEVSRASVAATSTLTGWSSYLFSWYDGRAATAPR